jgi:phospholipid/cholesterol/gamma-HCH transport system substrate-binding protein
VDARLRTSRPATAETDRPFDPEEVRQVSVGGAAVLAFAAVLVLSYVGASFGAGSSASSHIFATFNRIDGLAVGAEVQVSGVPVGYVDSMTLESNYRARVGMRIDDSIKVPTDTSAAIHTDGLFGRKYVVLEPGGDDEMLADGGVITFTQDSLIVSELLDLIINEGRAQQAAAPVGSE